MVTMTRIERAELCDEIMIGGESSKKKVFFLVHMHTYRHHIA